MSRHVDHVRWKWPPIVNIAASFPLEARQCPYELQTSLEGWRPEKGFVVDTVDSVVDYEKQSILYWKVSRLNIFLETRICRCDARWLGEPFCRWPERLRMVCSLTVPFMKQRRNVVFVNQCKPNLADQLWSSHSSLLSNQEAHDLALWTFDFSMLPGTLKPIVIDKRGHVSKVEASYETQRNTWRNTWMAKEFQRPKEVLSEDIQWYWWREFERILTVVQVLFPGHLLCHPTKRLARGWRCQQAVQMLPATVVQYRGFKKDTIEYPPEHWMVFPCISIEWYFNIFQ